MSITCVVYTQQAGVVVTEMISADSPRGHRNQRTTLGRIGPCLTAVGMCIWLGVLTGGLVISLLISWYLVIWGVRELLVHAGVIVDDVSGPWPAVAWVVAVFAGYLWMFGWLVTRGLANDRRKRRANRVDTAE